MVPSNKMAIDRGGGIQPLVGLLSDTRRQPNSKKYAAAALARLSAEERVQRGSRSRQDRERAEQQKKLEQGKASKAETIAEAGAIAPLVDLLSGDKGGEAQEEAAGALLALADNEGNRMAITESGGIGPLVLLLGCPNDKARAHAEGALVRLSIETTNRFIIIKQLVGMLDPEKGTSAQEQAAAALANLARESTENRTAILEAGGIPRLLALLHSTSAKAKENSASAIAQLAYKSLANQTAIAEANGISTLVSTLQSASLNVKEISGVKLCELTAAAIWNMADDNPENKTRLMKEGAIPPVVGLVTNPVPEMQTNAAGALACLSKDHPDNQAAIARSGAIPPLCTNVRDGTPETREESAAALWALATDNAPNKATIAKLGGIEPLVNMLMYGSTDKSSFNAAGALAALATQHADNRLTITKRLVGVLGAKAPAARAVRLLSALASLCENEATNQVAIAKSGGIQHLITWLGNSSEDVQVQAAKAMLSVAGNNSTTQALIGKLGGIPPLVSLMKNSVLEAQEHSACALWHLATLSENRVIINKSNGIPPLVSLLLAEGTFAAQIASMTLLRLATGSSRAAVNIALSGGIKPLVVLLTRGNSATQQMAAAALAAIALVARNRDEIANADAIKPLIKLLTDRTLGTPETAARALANLARDDKDDTDVREGTEVDEPESNETSPDVISAIEPTGDAGVVESKTTNDTIASDDESDSSDSDEDGYNGQIVGAESRRTSIKQAGGLRLLIAMLDGSNLSPSEALKPSTIGGWAAARVGIAGCIEMSSIFPGSQVDFGVKIGMQEQAAASLASIALGDEDMQDAVVQLHGVHPLLSLIRSGTPLSQEQAAATMWYLATAVHNQQVIVENHAIGDLVALLKSGSPNAQYFCAAALSELAGGAIKQRDAQKKYAGSAPGAAPAASSPPEDTLGATEVPPQDPSLAAPSLAAEVAGAPVGAPAGAPAGAAPAGAAPAGAAPAGAAPAGAAPAGAAPAGAAPAGAPAPASALAPAHRSISSVVLTAINDAGGVPPLVKLCEFGTPGGKEKAACAMWHLAIDPENQASIAANGGIKPLVTLLADGNDKARRHASDAMTRLATENPENQAQIAKRLVGLLDHDDASVVSRAAHDLQALAQDHPGAPMVIVNAGAISPLVTVLSNGKTDEGRNEAAKTLHTLANSGPANQLAIAVGLVALLGVGTDQAQEYVTQLLLTLSSGLDEDIDNRKAIANAGPFKMLVQQLRSDSVRVRMLAAAVMSRLSGDSNENVQEIANANGIQPLVALLGSEDSKTQEYATAVLADMTRRNQEHAVGVASEGGTPLLVAMLNSDHSTECKAHVASALGSIAVEHSTAVGDAGAIEPLVALLATGHPTAQHEAALALAGIAAGGRKNQDSVKAAGGLELLVGLLHIAPPGEGTAVLQERNWVKVQSNAAKALAELARDNPSNQLSIQEAGGIEPLISLITDTSQDQPQEEAAGALWSLSAQNADNQAAIAKAGGIDSLVTLVGLATDRGQEQAAGALASLALDNAKNQASISQQLVDLLKGSSAIQNTREKAARAVSRFARADSSNQDTIAEAGGIALTVSLLEPKPYENPALSRASTVVGKLDSAIADEGEEGEEGDDEPKPTGEHHKTQTELCAALWSLAADNSENQTAIATESGISLLIAMLSDHPHIHREAAGALWSLSADPVNQKLIAEAEGIPMICSLLKYGAKNILVRSEPRTHTGICVCVPCGLRPCLTS